jgi:RTX calcium-binding nonapeptide repeat (4 copies)
MDYYGTSGDDILDQEKLKLGNNSKIYGGAGNDNITVLNGSAQGQAGNDTLISLGKFDVVHYWDSPAGIYADLQKGEVQDGFGSADTLINFRRIHGSNHNDTLLGTSFADSFWGMKGDDYIDGRSGYDIVEFYNADASKFSITYNLLKDEVTVEEKSPDLFSSNAGIKTLKNIEEIHFSSGSVEQTVKVSDLMNRTDVRLSTGKVINVSLAGSWIPNYATMPDSGWPVSVVNFFYAQIKLPNGRNGLVLDSWSYAGWDNKVHYPVHMALLEQDANGHMKVATGKYIGNDLTNGAGSVLVADFNQDGQDDIFIGTHNESPLVPLPSTAYLSNKAGTFDKVSLSDSVCAHDATLFTYNGKPAVLASTYGGDGTPMYQFTNGSFVETKAQVGQQNNASGCSAAVADFNLDGQLDVAMADNNFGPGLGYRSTNPSLIGIYKLSDLQNNSGAAQLFITPYFNDKPQYKNIVSMNGPGQTHAYRIWTDDFNQDGRPDLISAGSLWSATMPDQWYNAFQMLQNTSANKQMSFTDKTASLSAYPLRSFEVDYSMQMLDIDGSGIKTYFMAGSGNTSTLNDQGLIDNTLQNNYILLNDGTGKLYAYYHNEFALLSQQIERYYGINDQLYGGEKRFVSFLTPENHINFLMVIKDREQVNGKAVLKETFINVPTELNPTTDFQQNIEVLDRNQSKNIRTWAGNDTIHSLNSNSAINTNSSSVLTTIDGGLGIDTSVYNADSTDFTIIKLQETNKFKLTNRSGSIQDLISNVERIKFTDKSLALDTNGNAGITAKILGAVFGKESISNKSYVGIGLHFLDAGWTYDNLAALALDAAGAKTNDQIVSLLWKNVIQTTATTNDKAPYIAMLENGMTPGALAHLAADTAFNTTNINLTGLTLTGIEYS